MRNIKSILLIEPSAILAEGLKSILAAGGGDVQITATLPDLHHYQEKAALYTPDLILVDTFVLDYGRRHSLKSYFTQHPKIPIAALVNGLVEPEVMKQFCGGIYIYEEPTKILRKVRQFTDQKSPDNEPTENYELSDREIEILISVAKGLTNKEIADEHHISIHTVISHRKNITRKTGIKTVSGLTVYALLNELIDQTDI